jgi:hypothetical protein
MRSWLCLVFLAWVVLPLVANDTAVVGQGGRLRRLEGEHAGVRMVRERIAMEVYHAFYTVSAEFTFRNEGPACTVQMGFPETGMGDINVEPFRAASGFQKFVTWVDKTQVEAQRRSAPADTGYAAFWTKAVPFAAGQVRVVKVQYQSHPGTFAVGTRYVPYTFSGGNWKGTVAESVLDATFHIPESCLVNAPPTTRDPKNPAHFHFVWRNWQAEEDFRLVYASTWPEWLTIPDASEEQPFSGDTIMITSPGRLPDLDWIPPALVRDGVAYIGFDVLQRYLRDKRFSSRITTSWDPATNTVALQVGSRKLGYKLKSTTMTVDTGEEKTTVILPAAPFMSRPGLVATDKYFVPAVATLQALGATVAVDGKAHRMTITLPKVGE